VWTNDSIAGDKCFSAEQNALVPEMHIAKQGKTSIMIRVEINSE
jgi:hypothetical protein